MKYLHILQKLSKKSNNETYKIGAILVKGGSIISIGYNHQGTHKLIEYKRHLRPRNNTIHAEIHTVLGISKKEAEHCTVYVARFTSQGVANSKPCTLCQNILTEMGIKKVFYTATNKDKYQQLNL